MVTLNAKARGEAENVKTLRTGGEIPAVVYGKGEGATSISIPQKEFHKVWKEAGESGAVTLMIDGVKKTVLIHDVVNDPVKHVPHHVDFLVIDVNKPITVSIPLEFVGVSPAVKGGLGSLVKVLHEIEVTGLAKDIPHSLEVDISGLADLEGQIAVSELKLPKGVEALAEGTDIVASIAVVKEEVEEPTGPIDFSAIEVEKKGKKEEEGEEAAS